MTQYATVYVRTVKRRKSYPGAQTYKDPKSVTTDFVPGWNLGTLPLVSGGERIA